jgi:hypothetical protein
MNREIAVVLAALVAVLAAVGLLTGGTDSDEDEARSSAEPSIAAIARRVERVRELRFERLPRVRVVTGEQARVDGLRTIDREIPPREVAALDRVLKLLGLLPADAGMRDLLGKALSEQVGGYYSPETGTLSIVGESGGLDREVTLAHELTHALEDQHFGIDSGRSTGFRSERATADSALHEGTATVAMVDYVVLKQAGVADVPARLRGQALEELDDLALPASSGLPRYVREAMVFPYVAGAQLVNRIEGRGGWEAVNRAFGEDAPVSSEQIMHPRKYDARERPVRVRVPGLSGALPAGARLVEEGDFGEFDTEQVLREANGRARSGPAAAGWGGGAFALWRLPGAGHALALRWTWDSERDAREFERAAARTARALEGAVERRGSATALALAPSAAAARALARAALAE